MARELASLPPDKQREAWGRALALSRSGDAPAREVRMAVHWSSDSVEWSTPPEILTRVQAVLGAVDLDPCSPNAPNVPARLHFTEEDDGLSRKWSGRVFMNPPYGRAIDQWVEKLCEEYHAGTVVEAIALVPARTNSGWFHRFRDAIVCFIDGRLKFSGHEDSAPFPSAVVYLGARIEAFASVLGDMGDIWIRYGGAPFAAKKQVFSK